MSACLLLWNLILNYFPTFFPHLSLKTHVLGVHYLTSRMILPNLIFFLSFFLKILLLCFFPPCNLFHISSIYLHYREVDFQFLQCFLQKYLLLLKLSYHI